MLWDHEEGNVTRIFEDSFRQAEVFELDFKGRQRFMNDKKVGELQLG